MVLAAPLLVAALQNTTAQALTFAIVDLGTLGGRGSTAFAVSNGQVVGAAGTADGNNNVWHAFSWTRAGGMVDLGTLGGPYSSALGVSDGLVVGNSFLSDGGGHAVVWMPTRCPGDCNDDLHVTVDEILAMVSIALGNVDVSTCRAGDANRDGQITVDEILAAAGNALNGCPK